MGQALDSEAQALPGRVVITTYGNLVEQIASQFPPKTVITLPHERVRFDAPDTFVLLPGVEPVEAALMDSLPQLRLIQKPGVGTESIDVAAATERGIFVANVPSTDTGNAESVAELVIFHMLALARRFREAEFNLRHRLWGQPEGLSLWGKTVGIYGLGGVGQAIAKRLRPFDVRLMAIKRQPEPQLADTLGITWLGTPAERSQLLQESDFVIIAASANQGVEQPFGAEDFQQMKPTAYLINVARGAWVEESALVQAIQLGQIAGAGLDVFAHEPLDPQSPLIQANLNLTLTPHLGGRTDTAYAGIAKSVCENVMRVAQGKSPKNCLNEFIDAANFQPNR